jgi:restriction endonuclease S subunit
MIEQQLPKGWERVKFGEIAQNISKRVEPSKTKLNVYIGLEHIDPESLKIQRHGTPADVKGQKLLVKKGQIIFGKRRAYQRKVAIADYDGICSAHAMVLEAIPEKIIPEFLPFLMQSDIFMARAIAISEGSLSPTIKWRVLANQEFLLPTIKRQKELYKLLQKVDSNIDLAEQLIIAVNTKKRAIQKQLYSKSLRFKSDNGKCFPNWEEKQLIDIASPVKRITTETISNVMTISAGKGFLKQEDRFNRVIAGSSLSKYNFLKKNEFSYNRGNSKTYQFGCIYMLKEEEALVPFVYRSFSLKTGVPNFFAQLFESKYLDRQLQTKISSSARMDGLLNIGEKDFFKVKIPVPHEEEQIKISNFIIQVNELIKDANERASSLKQLKKSILNEIWQK